MSKTWITCWVMPFIFRVVAWSRSLQMFFFFLFFFFKSIFNDTLLLKLMLLVTGHWKSVEYRLNDVTGENKVLSNWSQCYFIRLKAPLTGIKRRSQQWVAGYLQSGPWHGHRLSVIVIIITIITNICHWFSLWGIWIQFMVPSPV
jgi:hypothetical protein